MEMPEKVLSELSQEEITQLKQYLINQDENLKKDLAKTEEISTDFDLFLHPHSIIDYSLDDIMEMISNGHLIIEMPVGQNHMKKV